VAYSEETPTNTFTQPKKRVKKNILKGDSKGFLRLLGTYQFSFRYHIVTSYTLPTNETTANHVTQIQSRAQQKN
jgi:hypothetical protein